DVDPVTFTPRYRLVYGSVGESLGLAMARRLRLPDEIIDAAEAGQAAATRELATAIAALEVRRRRFEGERAGVDDGRRARRASAEPADDEPPQPGDNVEVLGTSIRGELIEIHGETARLRSGALTFQAPLAHLRRRLPDAPAPTTRWAPRPATDEDMPSELHLV